MCRETCFQKHISEFVVEGIRNVRSSKVIPVRIIMVLCPIDGGKFVMGFISGYPLRCSVSSNVLLCLNLVC